MGWVEQLYRKQAAQQAAYSRALNQMMPKFDIPVGDSDYTAPGYLLVAEEFSTIPDVRYPWDPAIVRAIREFCPDVVPLLIRSVWRWSNYNEWGHLGEPLVIVRHGIARAISGSDLKIPAHQFYCQMPSGPGYGIKSRYLPSPNWMEVNWYDKEDRPYGFDLPGAYLPFDWEFYHCLRRAYESTLKPKELAKRFTEGRWDADQASKRKAKEDAAYISRDLEKFYCIEPSDSEWKAAIQRTDDPHAEPERTSVSVPGGAAA